MKKGSIGQTWANENKDTGCMLHTQRGTAGDLANRLHGLRQEQVVAIHMNANACIRGVHRNIVIFYFNHGGLDVRHKRKTIVPVEHGWATIYAFHKALGVQIITGNEELAKIREDAEALGALIAGMQQIQDRNGRATSRLQLCGRADVSLAKIGINWFNLSQATIGRPGIIVIDVDQATDTIYGFRMNADGKRTAIVRVDSESAVNIMDTSKWTTLTSIPPGAHVQFAGAGRLIRAKDGTVAGDVAFTDNTQRAMTIKNGRVSFGVAERAHDEQVLSRVFFGNQPGLATQTIVEDGVEINFYPPAQIARAHRAYAEIPQNA